MNAPTFLQQETDVEFVRGVTRDLLVLAHISPRARVLVAGPHSMIVFNELCRLRRAQVVTTASNATTANKWFDVAIVPWYRTPLEGLDLTLNQLVRLVRRHGALAIWTDRAEDNSERKLRDMLRRVGFHIEVGTISNNGHAVVARRNQLVSLAMAA